MIARASVAVPIARLKPACVSRSLARMNLSVSLLRPVAVLLLAAALCGCPGERKGRAVEEDKDPCFIEGRRYAQERNTRAAIDAFERALANNRKSVSAHWELATLFETVPGNPIAALYHYDQVVQLSPGSGRAELAKTRVMACKQDLARSVSLGPVTDRVQRDLERLLEENRRLTEEIRKLGALAGAAGQTGAPPASTNLGPGRGVGGGGGNRPVLVPSPRPGGTPAGSPAATPRTHTVKAHETLGLIARQYGIRVEALVSANGGLDARRLHPGQVLVIPR